MHAVQQPPADQQSSVCFVTMKRAPTHTYPQCDLHCPFFFSPWCRSVYGLHTQTQSHWHFCVLFVAVHGALKSTQPPGSLLVKQEEKTQTNPSKWPAQSYGKGVGLRAYLLLLACVWKSLFKVENPETLIMKHPGWLWIKFSCLPVCGFFDFVLGHKLGDRLLVCGKLRKRSTLRKAQLRGSSTDIEKFFQGNAGWKR